MIVGILDNSLIDKAVSVIAGCAGINSVNVRPDGTVDINADDINVVASCMFDNHGLVLIDNGGSYILASVIGGAEGNNSLKCEDNQKAQGVGVAVDVDDDIKKDLDNIINKVGKKRKMNFKDKDELIKKMTNLISGGEQQ